MSLAGSAPARSKTARLSACSTVKLPVIWPEPPVIGPRMRGAEMTLPSSTMANGRPTLSEVTWPKRWPPRRLKRKLTSGSPVRESKPGCASTRSSPDTITRFSTGNVPPCCCGSVSTSLGRLAGVGDEAELELGGGAEQLLQLGRVLQARHLDDDAVDALLLDVGLLGAGAVEAAVQHFDRLARPRVGSCR